MERAPIRRVSPVVVQAPAPQGVVVDGQLCDTPREAKQEDADPHAELPVPFLPSTPPTSIGHMDRASLSKSSGSAGLVNQSSEFSSDSSNIPGSPRDSRSSTSLSQRCARALRAMKPGVHVACGGSSRAATFAPHPGPAERCDWRGTLGTPRRRRCDDEESSMQLSDPFVDHWRNGGACAWYEQNLRTERLPSNPQCGTPPPPRTPSPLLHRGGGLSEHFCRSRSSSPERVAFTVRRRVTNETVSSMCKKTLWTPRKDGLPTALPEEELPWPAQLRKSEVEVALISEVCAAHKRAQATIARGMISKARSQPQPDESMVPLPFFGY